MTKTNIGGLPGQLLPFVGYPELQELLGVSRRTIERMVRDGRFPPPVQLSPNRVVWPAETLTEWAEGLKHNVLSIAVTDPEQLAPEQVMPAMLKLGARYVSEKAGKSIAPDEIELNMWCDTSDYDTRLRLISRLRELCHDFELGRAQIIAAALFESVRERLAASDDGFTYRNPELLRKLASAAIDDDDWANLTKEFLRLRA